MIQCNIRDHLKIHKKKEGKSTIDKIIERKDRNYQTKNWLIEHYRVNSIKNVQDLETLEKYMINKINMLEKKHTIEVK